jgi:hypothetical protein
MANPSPPPPYSSNDTRPAWRAHANRALVEEYNDSQGTNVARVPYTTEQLARCHILSFEDIQTKIVSYLNDTAPGKDAEFTAWVRFVIAGIIGTDESDDILQAAIDMMQAPSIGTANELLGGLNSLTDNLRAAPAVTNSYVGQHPDPRGDASPGGQWHASSSSRRAIAASAHPLLLTPEHQSRIVASEGPIPLGSLSPVFQQQLQGQPWETKGIQSSNTMNAIYPGSGNTSVPAAPGGTFNFPGAIPAPAHPVDLFYEYIALEANPAPNPQEEARFQQLRATLLAMKLL